MPGAKGTADGRRNSQGQYRGTEKKDIWLQPLNAFQVSMDQSAFTRKSSGGKLNIFIKKKKSVSYYQ